MQLLLDTDIGSDIDDCFALAYLLSRKDVELVGITTCTGQPHLRASLAAAVCADFGKKVPIHVGHDVPLTPDPRPHQRHLTPLQHTVAEKSCSFSPQNTAVEFMRQTIEAHPHQITLAAIGPLTNVAVLFQKYPHIPALLAGAVLMCGRYGECDSARWGEQEWNVICDPRAAETVFAQAIPNCRVLGVEQTCRTRQDPPTVKKAFARHPAVASSVYPDGDGVWFHDAVAVAALFEPFGQWERGNITLQNTTTHFTPDPNGRHTLLRSFDPETFFAHYKKITEINF